MNSVYYTDMSELGKRKPTIRTTTTRKKTKKDSEKTTDGKLKQLPEWPPTQQNREEIGDPIRIPPQLSPPDTPGQPRPDRFTKRSDHERN